MTIKTTRQRLHDAEQAYKEAHPGRDLTVAREELTEARAVYYRECSELVERLPDLLRPFYEQTYTSDDLRNLMQLFNEVNYVRS